MRAWTSRTLPIRRPPHSAGVGVSEPTTKLGEGRIVSLLSRRGAVHTLVVHDRRAGRGVVRALAEGATPQHTS